MLQTWPLELSIYIQSSSQTELKAALVHLVSTKIVPSKNSFISEVPAFMLETSLAEIISFSSGLKDSLLILLLMVGSCSVFVLPSRIHILLYNTLFQLLKHISSLYHQLGRWATSRSIQGCVDSSSLGTSYCEDGHLAFPRFVYFRYNKNICDAQAKAYMNPKYMYLNI